MLSPPYRDTARPTCPVRSLFSSLFFLSHSLSVIPLLFSPLSQGVKGITYCCLPVVLHLLVALAGSAFAAVNDSGLYNQGLCFLSSRGYMGTCLPTSLRG